LFIHLFIHVLNYALMVVAATRPPGGCHDNEMQCRDGSCITSSWRCDRHLDCDDGSDEDDCGTVNHIILHMYPRLFQWK